MKFFLSTIAALFVLAAYGQTELCEPKIFDEEEFEVIEANMNTYSLNTTDLGCNKIRIVVHIVYNSDAGTFEPSGEISLEQVYSQIRISNQFFRNDSLMYDPENTALGYELELAKTDPDGNPTSGIIYHDGFELFGAAWSEYGLQNTDENAISEGVLSQTLSWGTDIYGKKYLNSYVVPKIDGSFGSGTQAYAYFPTSNVVYGNYNLSNAFGAEQLEYEYDQNFSLKTYTDMGLTWTHELLHNFAIFHTFNGNSCEAETNSLMQGDRVTDTPPQTQGIGCSGSCGFLSNNVMDYLSQSCKNKITNGQVERANQAITNSLSDYIVCDAADQCNKPHDFNGDGFTNIQDISLISNTFGCSEGDKCFLSIYDLNCDGEINITDISILQGSFQN